MDIIYRGNYVVTDWCQYLPDEDYSLIVKLAGILLALVALLQVAISEGNRSKGIQLLIILVAIFLMAGWQVPIPYHTPRMKAFIVMLSMFCILALPCVIPTKISGTRFIERKSVWMIYGLIVLLLAMQILGGC